MKKTDDIELTKYVKSIEQNIRNICSSYGNTLNVFISINDYGIEIAGIHNNITAVAQQLRIYLSSVRGFMVFINDGSITIIKSNKRYRMPSQVIDMEIKEDTVTESKEKEDADEENR